jgi:hypothetical protein
MYHDIDAFNRLVRALWSEQNQAWTVANARNKPSTKARAVFEKVLGHPQFCNQLSMSTLEQRLPSAKNKKLASDFGHMYLRLPPIERASNFAAFLWLGYDFTTKPQRICLRVTMFCIEDGRLEHFPFRLEYGEGMHNFYHAQLGNSDGAPNPAWLPCKQPSFPLAANCPVTAMLALLLTLYGVNETGRLLTLHGIPLGAFKKTLEPFVALK